MKEKVLLATTNKSKIRPFKMAWDSVKLNLLFELITLDDINLPDNFFVDEDTENFELDSLKKAMAYSSISNMTAISLDRGIGFKAMQGWPGTKTKEVLAGSDKRNLNFEGLKLKLTGKELDIARTQAMLNKIKGLDRSMESRYGIAVCLRNGSSISDTVVIKGMAAENLNITDHGYFYDWFFIPNGYKKTLSEFEEKEYLLYISSVLWPITEKILNFLEESYTKYPKS
jgi:inosine/xanthosine triphosphate pyrophosphatase family protein